MFVKHSILIINVILLFGFLHGAQSKQCYNCEGINCLRTSKVKDTATCIDPVDDCVTVFEGLTIIARGCYSTLPEQHRRKCDSGSDAECHKCYKNLCNDKGAIECLQCNSSNNENCSTRSSSITSSRCPVSTSPNSYCYTRTSSNNVERGCLLDANEQIKCQNDNSCEMCLPDIGSACNRESGSEVTQSGATQITVFSMLFIFTWLINFVFLR